MNTKKLISTSNQDATKLVLEIRLRAQMRDVEREIFFSIVKSIYEKYFFIDFFNIY